MTDQRIETMKGALQILERALSSLAHVVAPGVTPRDLAIAAERIMVDAGARAVLPEETNDAGARFAWAACVCVNDAAANATPTDIPLARGDLVTLDIAFGWPLDAAAKGTSQAVVDGATTVVVGNAENVAATRLRDAARGATRACLAAVQPGVTPAALREVAEAIARAMGVSLAAIPLVHRVQQGHGPLHVALPEHLPLQPGDVIAIEPLVVDGPPILNADADGFTLRTDDGRLAAYEECTMVVGDDESSPRIVPLGALRPWLFR